MQWLPVRRPVKFKLATLVFKTSGVTRGQTAQGDTIQGGCDTRMKLDFGGLNLQTTLDKRRWKGERVGVVTRRWIKMVITL